jgi:hypothetical protein
MVSLEGLPLAKATIHGVVESGFVHVAAPSPALRKRLREIQAAIASKGGDRREGYVQLDIKAKEIEAVRLNGDAASLKLTPAGTSRLRTFKRDNVGRVVTVSIEGVPAATTTVIDWRNGRLQIHAPSPALRKRLHEIQEERSPTSDGVLR